MMMIGPSPTGADLWPGRKEDAEFLGDVERMWLSWSELDGACFAGSFSCGDRS